MDCNFICPECGKRYPASLPLWQCECGSYLDLDFKPVPDKSCFSSTDLSMWRYRDVLPLTDVENCITMGEGMTPLVPMNISGIKVMAKLEYVMPTGSFKDRGASMMISKCKELGITEIVEDSSGNSACSVAAYCANAGIKANIYMPAGNSSAKGVQVKAYGAHLHKIPGNRIDCANAALEGAKMSYYAAHAWSPFFVHGAKTVIYEVVEQMNWVAPDYFLVPVGSGSQLIGAYLGLKEMLSAGIITKMPKLIAVQSEKCSPLKDFVEGRETVITPDNPTIAEGISIHKPVRLKQIIECVLSSGGDFITVSDNEIIDSLKESFKQGVYIEPTSASSAAAVKKIAGKLVDGDIVVISLTGSGLKSSSKIESLI